MFTGFKTVLVGAAYAVIPALTEYAGVVDWSFLGPTGALIAGGLTMIVMRLITSTSVFAGKQA